MFHILTFLQKSIEAERGASFDGFFGGNDDSKKEWGGGHSEVSKPTW